MRNNYQIDRSEDSISKISRSKSKNQVSITAKWRNKVSIEFIAVKQMEW